MYSPPVPDSGRLRIGELSRRSGVSPELLRAWERRYGLLSPIRSKGGLRLYSADDLGRVQAMQRLLAEGMAAAEAASVVAGHASAPDAPLLDPTRAIAELRAALDAFDEPAAQALLDQLFATATVDLVLSTVIVPFLHDLGDRWERGEASVAQEHFAGSVIRGRMLGLARGWGLGVGPVALLACLAGEQHDLGALAFGLALRSRGWRVSYFGADTPLETIKSAAELLDPALVVVAAVTDDRVRPVARELEALAGDFRVALGGAAALTAQLDADVLRLGGDPVEEAERVTALIHAQVAG
jgi:DNA-binding transcriptional MerR regulator